MYARRTKVPVNHTRGEIESMLLKRGASGFLVGSNQEHAMLMFEMQGWRLRFMLPLPKAKRGNDMRAAQETRRRWRALLLVLKAKLEAVDSGIVEFEREFLPFICTTNSNSTVADQIVPNLGSLVSSGKMPPLLGPGGDE